MRFSLASHGFFLPKAFLLALLFLDLLHFIVSAILFYSGLARSSARPQPPSGEDLAFLFCLSSTESTQAGSSAIKNRLPVIEFARIVERRPGVSLECMVCLERLAAKDEVRELSNCVHVFHRKCIDRWADVGRSSCPVCRSRLLPAKQRRGDRLEVS